MPLPDNTIKVTVDLGTAPTGLDLGTPPTFTSLGTGPSFKLGTEQQPTVEDRGSPPQVKWIRTPTLTDPGELEFEGGSPPKINWGQPPELDKGTLPTIDLGAPPHFTGGTPPSATIEMGNPVVTAKVEGGATPVAAQIGNLPSETFAATISGPKGNPIEALVGGKDGKPIAATIGGDGDKPIAAAVALGGNPDPKGLPIQAVVTAYVGGTETPIKLDPITLKIGGMQLKPNLTIRFNLFACPWLPLLSIRITGTADAESQP